MGETGRFCRISPFFPCAEQGRCVRVFKFFCIKIQEADIMATFRRRDFPAADIRHHFSPRRR